MKYAYEGLSEVGGASDPRSNATHAVPDSVVRSVAIDRRLAAR